MAAAAATAALDQIKIKEGSPPYTDGIARTVLSAVYQGQKQGLTTQNNKTKTERKKTKGLQAAAAVVKHGTVRLIVFFFIVVVSIDRSTVDSRKRDDKRRYFIMIRRSLNFCW